MSYPPHVYGNLTPRLLGARPGSPLPVYDLDDLAVAARSLPEETTSDPWTGKDHVRLGNGGRARWNGASWEYCKAPPVPPLPRPRVVEGDEPEETPADEGQPEETPADEGQPEETPVDDETPLRDIFSGLSVDEVKAGVRSLDFDPAAALEEERAGKNRTSLVGWLENLLTDEGE